jgi:hypothetical protein
VRIREGMGNAVRGKSVDDLEILSSSSIQCLPTYLPKLTAFIPPATKRVCSARAPRNIATEYLFYDRRAEN